MSKTSRERPRRTTPQGGPIFAPPPMWAPTPAERLGNYPPEWKLKSQADIKSSVGCFTKAGVVMICIALAMTIISHLVALLR